jgi:hypothetical protein
MANKFIGEVALPIGDATYTLRLSVREMIAIETKYGESFNKAIGKILVGDDTKVTDCVSLLNIMLKGNHPDMTEDRVCDFITEVGLSSMVDAMVKAITAATPKSEAATSANPPEVKAAT